MQHHHSIGRTQRATAIGLITALTLAAAACNEDDATPDEAAGTGGTGLGGAGGSSGKPGAGGTSGTPSSSGGASGEGDGGPEIPPVYAMAVQVFAPDNSATMYLSVLDSLDIDHVDLARAYEFPGQSDIAAFGGYLYVSSGEEPTIQRYTVAANGKLVEGPALSFANLGLTDAPLRSNTFIDAHKSYLLAPNGQHAIWDPTTLEITGVVDIPDMKRGEMMLDGSSAVVRGHRLYRTFYWEDWSTYTFSEEQYIATFDTEQDKLVSLAPERRCPNLGALGQIDENGTIYFSNWFYNVPGTLMKGAPESCAVRIPNGSDDADPEWKLVFNELTGGHEGAQLSYLAHGKAVFAAVHEEDIEYDRDTAPYELTGSPNWEAWEVGLATRNAAPVAGIERMAADQTIFELDDRTFLLAPNDDYSATTAYEILPDGSGRQAFTVAGYSRAFVKVR